MANKNLFKSTIGKLLPKADTINEASGRAYSMGPKQALAQYAATGCMNGTFYASAATQLDRVIELAAQVEPEFIAKTALYVREKAFMKDVPALLTAMLSVRSPFLFAEVFPRVIDNAKMLRNFVQIMRSGAVGRKSLGSLPKRLVEQWLANRSDDAVFKGSVGSDPSMSDVIKMVHPRPGNESRAALYAYLIGRPYDFAKLPKLVQSFELFKKGQTLEVPDVPFDMLTALPLSPSDWKAIARSAPWQMTRMNLNTFARHGAFEDEGLTMVIAERLANPELVRKSRVLPYQLMAAYSNCSGDVPEIVKAGLQDALDHALVNVPKIDGTVYVFPDVSGSMHSPVTGYRKGSSSAVRCIDVAALVAAAMLRANPRARVIPFNDSVVDVRLNPRDSVLTNAQKLAALPQGGTNCSAPLQHLNFEGANADLVIYVSDNESWVDTVRGGRKGEATQTMKQWAKLKQRSPDAKMACIDIQPYATTQAPDSKDILNVGGFSDQVFDLLGTFAKGSMAPEHWVGVIESVSI